MMPTYEEVLAQVQKLNSNDQSRLLEELRLLVYKPTVVEGTDEVIPADEIAANDAALQDYRAGRDTGISSAELKQKYIENKTYVITTIASRGDVYK